MTKHSKVRSDRTWSVRRTVRKYLAIQCGKTQSWQLTKPYNCIVVTTIRNKWPTHSSDWGNYHCRASGMPLRPSQIIRLLFIEYQRVHRSLTMLLTTNAHHLIVCQGLAHAVVVTLSSLYTFLLIYSHNEVLCCTVFKVGIVTRKDEGVIHARCWQRGLTWKLPGSSHRSRFTRVGPQCFNTDH